MKTFSLFILACASLSLSAQTEKPNILIINIDDLGWNDVQYQKNVKSPYYSPNIEKIARQSMVFSTAYSACPVCSPSRASVVTGKTTARLKLTAHIAGVPAGIPRKTPKGAKWLPAKYEDQLALKEVTFAEILKTQGYRTGFIGKWHLAGAGSVLKKELEGNVAPEFHPEHQGFDVNIAGCAYGQPKSYFDPYQTQTLPDRKKGEYLTDRLADEAVKFISDSKDKPFLLYLNPYSVHTPIRAPQERVEALKKLAPGKKSNKYAAMIYSVDLMIGKITAHLDKLQLTKNTLLIITSDNGGLFDNAPLRSHKGTLYEGGIRVPFIVRWPGKIKANSSSDIPIIGYDIFPTILDAAECLNLAPEDIDGQSLLPIISDKGSIKRKQALLWHYPHYHHGGLKSLDMGTALREGDWKFIYIYKTGKSYLFNLKADPQEKNNLTQAQPERSSALKKTMDSMLKEMDANMPILAK